MYRLRLSERVFKNHRKIQLTEPLPTITMTLCFAVAYKELQKKPRKLTNDNE